MHFFNLKFLWIGLLLACPPVSLWAMRNEPAGRAEPTSTAIRATPGGPQAEGNPMKVPVEVVSKDGKREWIHVELAGQSIPEPGITALLFLSSLLLLRRHRDK